MGAPGTSAGCGAGPDEPAISRAMPPVPATSPLPAEVLQKYGETMLAAQAYERTLALHVLALSRKPSGRRAKDLAGLTRAIDKILGQAEHAFQRGTASKHRDLLPADFDATARTELEQLIPVRNRLAHRYLIEQLAIPPVGGSHPAVSELEDMYAKFMAANDRLMGLHNCLMARRPKPESMPEEYRALLTRTAEALYFSNLRT